MFEGQELPIEFEGKPIKVGDKFIFRPNKVTHTVALHPNTLRFLLKFTNRTGETEWASIKQMALQPEKWNRV